MSKSSVDVQRWLREPIALAGAEWSRRSSLDSSQVVAIRRLTPWLACAGVLSMAWPAAAQDPAPDAKTQPAPDTNAQPAPETKADPAPDNEAQPAPDSNPQAAAAPAEPGADAPPPEAAPEEAEEEVLTSSAQNPQNLEEITVSGRRQSLAAALRRKKNSTSQVDAIVADDMAKFPDLTWRSAGARPGVSIRAPRGGRGSRARALRRYTPLP